MKIFSRLILVTAIFSFGVVQAQKTEVTEPTSCPPPFLASSHCAKATNINDAWFPTGPTFVCQGTTVSYSFPAPFLGPNESLQSVDWQITGGTILTSKNSTHVNVQWNSSGTITAAYNVLRFNEDMIPHHSCECQQSWDLQVETVSITSSPQGLIATCEGTPVTLVSSPSKYPNSSVSVQWNKNGTPIPGATNNTFQTFNDGVYTVTASVIGGSCSTISSPTTVQVKQGAQLFNITGGGSYCEGVNGVSIGLDGFEPGVTYTLSSPLGFSASDNTSPIQWDNIQQIPSNIFNIHLYQVTATKDGCSRSIGSVDVKQDPNFIPFTFDISGNSTYCSGTNGANIFLDGSESGVVYRLMSGSDVVETLFGNTQPLIFSPHPAGNYTIVAQRGTSNCFTTMNGSSVISVLPVPSSFNLTGSDFCGDTQRGSVTLNGSETSDTYQLYRESVPWGNPMPGGGSITWSNLSAGGRYEVIAKANNQCTTKMNGDITITDREPLVSDVFGGGTACPTGKTISLSPSQTGFLYQLQKDQVDVGSPMAGSSPVPGATVVPITWTNISNPGIYTVVAYSPSMSGCKKTMDGSATISSGPSLDILATQYPCTIKLSSSITQLNNCGLSTFSWNLGDGTTATTPEVFHSYASDGTYTVTLTVTSICDGVTTCTSTASKQITQVSGASYVYPGTNFNASSNVLDQVINASAITFSDSWILPAEQAELSGMNPFLNGQRGVWRNQDQYIYTEARQQSTPVSIATDGTFSLNTFNWQQSALGLIPNWIKANTVTRYSAFGYEVENKDVLDVYSSAVYDYSGQLISAEGSNMRHDEMAFTSFETDVNAGNTGNWTFGSQSAEHFKTFPVLFGDGNMAVVEADISEFTGVTEMDVLAFQFKSDVLPFSFGVNNNSVSNDAVICITSYPTTGSQHLTTIVFNEAPFDGAWLGSVSFRKSETGVVATRSTQFAHTGNSSLQISSSAMSFPQRQLKLDKGKSYFITAWMKVSSGTSNDAGFSVKMTQVNGPGITTVQATPVGPFVEGWQQVSVIFSSPYDDTEVDLVFTRGSQSTAFFDDLRVHPNNGVMKSYVYDLKDYRLIAILDEQNFASMFSYDDEGNLTVTKKETERGIKTISENVTYIKANGN